MRQSVRQSTSSGVIRFAARMTFHVRTQSDSPSPAVPTHGVGFPPLPDRAGYCVGMSEENVEMVRIAIDAWNRGDWDAVFKNAAPDIEMTTPPEEPGITAGTYRGRDEIQGFWEGMLAAFEATSAEPEQLLERGDQVVAVIRGRLRPKGSSAEIELRNSHLWTFREGKVISLQLFRKPGEALEAAGLEE